MIPIPDKPRKTRRFWLSLAIFLASFFVLQMGWNRAGGGPLERWVIDCATVRTSVAIINTLTPHVAAVAHGPSILAASAGVNVRNGCEGTEIFFLLLAALLAYPFTWSVRLLGALAGALYVFLINQVRLVALFYAIRNDPGLFGQLHGVIAPLALVGCTVAFFVMLRRWDQARQRVPRG